ncbi:MAG: histone deacetylase family protein [Desulfurococcales archaeon]|nr:histone deacetylase family protein [Desulfurococcales archaeon]
MILKAVYHGDFRLHDPGPYEHPESPERLDYMLAGLRSTGLEGLLAWASPPEGRIEDFEPVHSSEYLRALSRRGRAGVEWLDPDTYIAPGTHRAVSRLAGAAKALAEEAASGGSGLLLPRPPGHHAGYNGAAMGAPTLGFCIVNTASLIARLLSRGGRVSMLDFDLHHGNGSQEIFYSDPRVQHVDIHQDSRTIYPGTGFRWQTGEGEARGSKLNFNVPPGSGDDAYRYFVDAAFSAILSFDPDYIVVSAGFDAYHGDNYMGSLRLTSSTYHYIGRRLAEASRPVVVVVEGGYSVGLERGLPALVSGLLGRGDPVGDQPSRSVERVRRAARLEAARALEEAGLT